MILYYITDRTQFQGGQVSRLIAKIVEAVAAGVDYVQLREKDLSARAMEELALRIPQSRLLINSRVDVALAVRAAGVHLPANEVSPREVQAIWRATQAEAAAPIISISCHSPEEVSQAARAGADLAIFAPVFEKKNAPPQGLAKLQAACGQGIPVLALGGVTIENAQACMQAGAVGIAGIRLFQENHVADVVAALR